VTARRQKKLPFFLRFSLIFLVSWTLTTVASFFLRPLERALQTGMAELRDRAVAEAESYLGRTIEYGSIGPSLFGILDIRNVRIYRPGSEEPALACSRFRVSYSLKELLAALGGGKPDTGIRAIRSIRIDRPVIKLDLEEDADLIALFSSGGDPQRKRFTLGADLLPDNLVVRIRGGAFHLGSRGDSFSLTGLSLDASAGERISLRGRWEGEGRFPELFKPRETAVISAVCGFEGEFTRDLSQGSLTLTVPAFSSELFSLRSVTASLIVADRRIEIRKIRDHAPFDLYLGYELDGRRFYGEFRAEEFAVRELVSLQGPWKVYEPLLELQNSGYVLLEGDAQSFNYRFDLSGGPPEKAPGPSYALAGRGDGNRLSFDRCRIQFPQGSIRYTGGLGFKPWSPQGHISVSDLSLTGDGRINAELDLVTQGSEISLSGENLSLGPVVLSSLSGALFQEEESLFFSIAALRLDGVSGAPGSVSLDGSYTRRNQGPLNPRRLEASLSFGAFALGDMLDMARPLVSLERIPGFTRDLLKELRISTEAFITTDFEHILYNVPRFVLARGGEELLTLSVSGTDQRLELSEGRIFRSGAYAGFAGYGDFENPQDITFSLRIAYLDLAYYLEGTILDRRSISIQGSYGLSGYIGAADTGGFSGYLQAEDLPLPLGEQFALLRFFCSLRYDGPSFWSAEIDRFDLTNLVTPASGSAALSFTALADQNGAQLTQLVFDDGGGALTGGAGVSWGRGFVPVQGGGFISDSTGLERLDLSGAYDGDLVELSLRSSRIQLGRFVRNLRGSLLTGDLALSWRSPSSFRADLNLGSLSARIGKWELAAAARGSLTEEALTISDVRVNYGDLLAEVPLFSVDLGAARAETNAYIRGGMGWFLESSFGLEADFEPVRSWFDMPRALTAFSGRLHVDTARFDAVEAEEAFDFTFSRTRDLFALAGGPRNMIRMRMNSQGDFYLGLSNPSPVRGSFIGSLNSETIDAHVSDLYVDLEALSRFLPRKDIIEFPGGFVTGAVQIRGPLKDPEFFGTIYGSSVRIRIPRFLAEDIGPVPVTVTLEGDEMNFGPLIAPVGSGAGKVSGWFLFERWVPDTFDIDIDVAEDAAIPFALDIMGFVAAGETWGRVKLSLEDLILTISGNMTGQNTRMTMNIQELRGGRDSGPSTKVSIVTDLTIRAGRKVEFAWPEVMPVLRTYADAGSEIEVTSDQSTGRYSLAGDIRLRSGEIYYFQRSFYLKEGILSFNENELRFDPRISARAEIRDRNDEGPVTIAMIIDNAPLLSFTARFESMPPLSQLEIFSLLGQNLTGDPSAEDGGVIPNAFVLATSDFLAQLEVVRGLERNVRDFLRLDMFSVRTQALQNAMLMVTGLQDPVDRIGRVGNYFDNTTVFFGKYVRSDMFVQSMLSFRYDETQERFGGMRFEPEIGIELQSPLFAIRWNFAPTFDDNDTVFIDDVSFTLTWRWTF
jgi:hypothetical protein